MKLLYSLPETAKQVPDFPAYFVDEQGNIYSTLRRGPGGRHIYLPTPHYYRKLSPYPTQKGYMQCRLSKDQRSSTMSVHRLICTVFHGPPPDSASQTMHLNDIKTDNRPCNLRWGTSRENHDAVVSHGLRRGERCGRAKLSAAQVLEIRDLVASGMVQTECARRFHVSPGAVGAIIHRRNWKHI